MKKILLLLVILAVALAAAKNQKKKIPHIKDMPDPSQAAQAEQEVTELTAENTEEVMKKSKYLIVLIVNNDRATHKLIEDYPQLNHNLRENGITEFTLSIVDSQFYKTYAKTVGVKKIPSLILFQEYGTIKDIYKGMNYIQDMFNWIYKTIKTPRTISKPIFNFDQFQEKLSQHDVVVTFFGTTPTTPEFKLFEDLASKRKDLYLTHTFDKECREENGYRDDQVQGIVMYNKKETQMNMKYMNRYNGDLLNVSEIKQFFKIYTTQSIAMIRPWDTDNIYKGALPNIVLGLNQADFFESQVEYENLMTPEELAIINLRPKLMNKAFLNILNITDRNREEVRTIFELKENYTLPQLFIVHPQNGKPAKKYIFGGDIINEETIMKFFQDFKKGLVQPLSLFENSYPQEKQDKLLVKHVVAQNWNEYVYHNNKQDVLVYFYSIGCTTCDNTKSMLYKLAYRLQNNKNLLIVRVNIGENDIPGVNVKRTPEIKLYKANDKDYPIQFIYTNNQKALLDSLQEVVSFPWVNPIAESEVNEADIFIDQTELEINHIKKMKEDEIKRKKQRQEEERKEKERIEKEQEEFINKQEENIQVENIDL